MVVTTDVLDERLAKRPPPPPQPPPPPPASSRGILASFLEDAGAPFGIADTAAPLPLDFAPSFFFLSCLAPPFLMPPNNFDVIDPFPFAASGFSVLRKKQD